MKQIGFLFFVVLMGTPLLIACGASQNAGTTSSDRGGQEPPIAEEWRARCASCHTRVEPGTRTRPQLEDAFARHRSRTRLTEAQWGELTDFLAAK